MRGSSPKEIMQSAAYRYAEDAAGGKLVVPKTIRQQAEHFLSDLRRSERGDWRYVFDLGAARRPIQFCEQFLTPTAGDYDTFHFLPWQEFVDCQAFGWLDRETGYRRYREVFEEVARGNGKTARNSGKAGYMLSKGSDKGAENYFLANNKQQARRCYMDFFKQMRMSPVLKKQLKLLRTEAWYEPINAVATFLGNDGSALDGLRPYFTIKDELEGERSFEQINQILRPMKKRRQAMMWYTGTAGTILDGPMVYLYNYAKRILERDPEINERAIDRFLPIIYEIDPDLPYEDPDNWVMANPSLGTLLQLDDLLADWETCQRSPRERVDFVTKQLNRFAVAPEAVFVDAETVSRNDQDDVQLSLLRPMAWGGFDLSQSEDFTSAAVIYSWEGKIVVHCHSWTTEEKMARGNGRENQDWGEYVRRGWLTILPGRYVRYEHVLDWFREQRSRYEIQAIGYDPYNATEFVGQLRAEGFRLVEVRQGPLTLNAPMKSLKEALLDGKINWMHNDMFRWYLLNVRLRADFFDLEKENWMPTKKMRYKKIDGFMAALDAYVIYLGERELSTNIYDDSHMLGGSLW